jgi:hypothetical protein
VVKVETLGKCGKYSPMVLFFAEKFLHKVLSRMSTDYKTDRLARPGYSIVGATLAVALEGRL